MRATSLVVVMVVVVLQLTQGVHVEFNDNDKVENGEKRIKSDLYDKFLEKSKLARKALVPLRKDSLEKQRKRCELCRESVRCKTQGKCDLCTRVCKDYETPVLTEAPVLGSVHLSTDEEGSTSRSWEGKKSGRYYTLGSFGPGPRQNLLVKLLNVTKKDNLDKVVVLGKPKGGQQEEDYSRPVIIDTANVFPSGGNGKEVTPELHRLDGAKVSRLLDLNLTSQIDEALERAIKRKQETHEKAQLTGQEMDKIIDRALAKYDQIVQQPPPKKEGNVMNLLTSRTDNAHITTKRSVFNREKSLRERLEERKFLKSRMMEEETQTENALIKRTVPEPNNQAGLRQHPLNGQGNSQVSQHDCAEGEDCKMLNLEPRPTLGKIKLPSEDDHDRPDSILTLTHNPSSSSEDDFQKTPKKGFNKLNLRPDPILKKSWLSKEVDKARSWLHENVGMKAPTKNTEEVETLQVAETKPNTVNASHFTWLLKNLEEKVENIADLVKKTCGKDEGMSDPKFDGKNQMVGSPEPSTNSIQVIEAPGEERNFAENPEDGKPSHILDETIDKINKGAESLISKVKDIAHTIQDNFHPSSPKLEDKKLAISPIGDETVACSKEESEEYVGNPSKTVKEKVVETDPTLACSKEDSEEYVGKALLDTKDKLGTLASRSSFVEDGKPESKVPESKPEDTVACSKEDSEEYVGDGLKSGKISANVPGGGEDVGCSKEESEEYVGEPKGKDKQNQNPKTQLNNEEEVGCSKEESEEYVGNTIAPPTKLNPVNPEEVGCGKDDDEEDEISTYGSYRESQSDPSEKSGDTKHLLPLDKLIQRNHPSHHGSKTSHQHLPKHHSSHEAQKRDPLFSESQRPQNLGPIPAVKPFHSKTKLPAPNQRFDKLPTGSSKAEAAYNAHHPKTIQNWPKHSDRDMVGVKHEDVDHEGSPTNLDEFMENPFSIFGKVVPQLNDSEISFEKGRDNKVYFVGTGMQLPLNMKKHHDGSYQLSVDMDKLCNNCNNGKMCSKISNSETVGLQPPLEELDGNNAQLTEEEHESVLSKEELKDSDGGAQTTNRQRRGPEPVILKQGKKQKLFQPVLHDSPLQPSHQSFNPALHQPSHAAPLQYSSGISFHQPEKMPLHQSSHQTVYQSPYESSDHYYPQEPHGYSHIAKRSVRRMKDRMVEEDKSPETFEDSLNTIDKYSRSYSDRMAKLERYYERPIQNEVEDVKRDVVKRRVTLVNNVLTWMKNFAVRNNLRN